SDHNLIHLLPVYKPLVHKEPAVTRTVKKWSKETEEALKDCFETTVWEELSDPNGEDIDSLTHCITDYVNFCVENTVTTKTILCFSNNNPDIKALLKEKKRAFRSGDKDELKAVQRELRRKIREGKASYRRKLQEQLQQNDFFNRFDHSPAPPLAQTSLLKPLSVALPTCCPPPSLTLTPSTTFSSQPPPTGSFDGSSNPFTPSTQPPCSSLSFTTAQVRNELRKIKAKKAAGPDGISARLLKSCADQLCGVVEHMFSMSLKLGRVLQLWKTSCVVPVPKTQHPKDLKSYRLVALTSHLMKPGEAGSYPSPPSGETIYGPSSVCLPASAFNTIQPGLLKDKLEHVGVESHLSNWILDYLTNRPQYVRTRDCVSDKVVSSTGAPQGTVLAPFLFTLYTADFMYTSLNCHLQKFSDDLAIVGLITNEEDSEYRELIQDFVHWCLQNHLQINAGKTKELVVDFH
ncbi:hypothetical protein NFI96_034387, partial [Prochilodus magdalenae]